MRSIAMSACLHVCLSVSVCMPDRSHISETTCPNFIKFSVHVTCGRGFSDDSAIRYVLPVLWMTSYLPIIGPAKATTVYIGRILKATHQGQNWGAKSDLYDCLVFILFAFNRAAVLLTWPTVTQNSLSLPLRWPKLSPVYRLLTASSNGRLS